MPSADIVILGAGLMGRVAAWFFVHHPESPRSVRLVDRDAAALDGAARWLASARVETLAADAGDAADLARALAGARVCVSCVPYFMNPGVARGALQAGVSMIDLGGNPEVTDEILGLDGRARQAGVVFIPDTGLAPGLVSILAWELAGRFQKCDEVHLRVGGLPQTPTGPLKYAQFFSIHGLLNEYFEDARELKDGREALVPSPSQLETLEFAGLGTFEAFVTSGGTSTTTRTMAGRVPRLDYKTIRYPGHYAALALLRDVGLTSHKKYAVAGCEVSPRQLLTAVLDDVLPKHAPDMILLRVTAKGDGGREEKIELVVKQDDAKGLSGMGIMTAFPAAAIALAIFEGQVPPGAHTQETVISYAWMKKQLGLFGIPV